MTGAGAAETWDEDTARSEMVSPGPGAYGDTGDGTGHCLSDRINDFAVWITDRHALTLGAADGRLVSRSAAAFLCGKIALISSRRLVDMPVAGQAALPVLGATASKERSDGGKEYDAVLMRTHSLSTPCFCRYWTKAAMWTPFRLRLSSVRGCWRLGDIGS